MNCKIQIIFILTLCLFLNSCNSNLDEKNTLELDLRNEQLCDKIWLGIGTPYTIKNTNDKEYFIKEIDNESLRIIKKGKNKYSILLKKKREYTIQILNEVNEVVQEEKIKTKYLPNLIPEIYGNSGGLIGKNTLLSYIERGAPIRVVSVNYDVDISYKVKEFELVTFDKKGKVNQIKSSSEHFNKKQIEHLLKLKSGDRFYLEKIIVDRLDGSKEKVRIMSFEIK